MDSTKMTMKEAERAKCNKTGERKATDPPKVISNRSRLHEHDGECRVSRVPPPRPKYPPSATPLPPALHPLPPPHVQPAPPPAPPHVQQAPPPAPPPVQPASPPAPPHAQPASPPAPQHVPPSPVQRPLHTPPPPPNAQLPPLPPPEDPRGAEPTSSFLSPVFNQVAAFAGWLFEAEVVAGDSNTSPVLSPGNRARNHFEEQERENLLPKNWVPMPRDDRGNDVAVHLVNLPRWSAEYQDVDKRFLKTVLVEKIVSIVRIQNPFLWQAYQLRKQKMDKDNGGNNERQLFHGTHPDNVTEINNQGFDRSFVGSAHGARYGAGVYFARDASYSVCYTDSSRRVMYLARVLVGKYCKGRENMRKPPAIDPQKPEILFDSMVDDMQDPSIFVVYYDNQCYPEYLIKFLKY